MRPQLFLTLRFSNNRPSNNGWESSKSGSAYEEVQSKCTADGSFDQHSEKTDECIKRKTETRQRCHVSVPYPCSCGWRGCVCSHFFSSILSSPLLSSCTCQLTPGLFPSPYFFFPCRTCLFPTSCKTCWSSHWCENYEVDVGCETWRYKHNYYICKSSDRKLPKDRQYEFGNYKEFELEAQFDCVSHSVDHSKLRFLVTPMLKALGNTDGLPFDWHYVDNQGTSAQM